MCVCSKLAINLLLLGSPRIANARAHNGAPTR